MEALQGFFSKLKKAFSKKSSKKGFQLLEEEPAPVMEGISGPVPGDKGYGRNVAEGVMERWSRVAADKPYDKMLDGLGKTLDLFNAIPDSRIGRGAVAPIKLIANDAFRLFGELNASGRKLAGAMTEESGTPDKVLQKVAEEVEGKFNAVDRRLADLAGSITTAIGNLQSALKSQAKDNLGKNYENLHGATVMFFEYAEKANTYFSLAIGVIATGVGHPHVGIAAKGAISGALQGAKSLTKLVQRTMDNRDPELLDQAEPLLPRDSEDVITIENIKTIAGYAKTAVTQMTSILGHVGIDISAVTDPEILRVVNQHIDAAQNFYHDEVKNVFDRVAAAAREHGTDLDGRTDEIASKAAEEVNKKLDGIREKIKAELQKRGEEFVRPGLAAFEQQLRGKRATESLDLRTLSEELGGVLEELERV